MSNILILYWTYLKLALESMLHAFFLAVVFASLFTSHYFALILACLGYLAVVWIALRLNPAAQSLPRGLAETVLEKMQRMVQVQRKYSRTQHEVLVQGASLPYLFSKIREVETQNNSWMERICSNPGIITKVFLGTSTAEEFLQRNQIAREACVELSLEIPKEYSDRIDQERLSIIALYPSGALRSVPCIVSLANDGIRVRIDDYLVFLDPELDQPTTDIQSFRAQITVFAVQC